MSLSRRLSDREAFLLLAAVVALGFGRGLGSLGFYNDDYTWLSSLSAASPATFWNLARTLVRSDPGNFIPRAGDLVYMPVLFLLGGVKPLAYQAVGLAADLAVAWNFHRLLVEEGLDGGTALLAATLAALYPNHDATHHWVTGAPQALAGTLWAVRASRAQSAPRRAAGAAVFLFCTMIYEAAGLLAFLPAILDFARSGPRAAARRWPLPACLAAVFAYQRVLVPSLLGLSRHSMSLSAGHALQVVRAGLECTVFNRLTDMIWRSGLYAAVHFRADGRLFLAASAAAVVAAAFWTLRRSDSAPDGRLPRLAALFFLLGYAPYFLDAKYTPSIFDPTNRINMVGSLGGALALTWLVLRLRAARGPAARAAGTVLLGASLCGFLLADQASNAQWSRAYALQQDVLAGLDPWIKTVPGPAVVLLYGVPDRIGSGSVFESTYDFDGALRLRFRRPELRGLVGSGRVRFDPGEAFYSSPGVAPLSYARLYAYDGAARVFARIDGPAAGAAFLAALPRR